MSQQIPFHPVSQKQNVYVRYKKISQEGKNKIRSGIIERYTYKTDKGELLKNPSIPTISNAKIYTGRIISIDKKSEKSSGGETPNDSRTTLASSANKNNCKINTPVRSYMHHIVHANVPITSKIGNSSNANNDERVRTEHCDSTTDILENFDIKNSNLFLSPYKQSNDDSASLLINVTRNSWKPSQDSKVETDSDCEIIEVKSTDTNDSHVSNNKNLYPVTLALDKDKEVLSLLELNKDIESPKTKVMDWISSGPLAKTESVIHIISDDSDEESEYLCDKTGLKTKPFKNELRSNKSEMNLVSTSDVQSFGKESIKNSDSSHRSIKSDKSNISIILQKQGHVAVDSKKSKDYNVMKLLNEKYYKIKSRLCRELKSPVISTPSSSNSLPPNPCSNMFENISVKKEIEPTNVQRINVQFPKMHAPLSPESMKSEFYNYLKINTNPSAQKAETIAQNRRSIRVKNLIMQIEKSKEKRSLRKENDVKKKDRANDIRKKFMKYTKPNVVFPSVPLDCHKFSDFDSVIQAYIYNEKIPYKLYQSYSDEKQEHDNNITIPKKQSKLHRNILLGRKAQNKIENRKQQLRKLQNRALKKKRRQQQTQKIIGCTPHISDIKLRKLRFRPNRIFRNSSVRITRHSLDGYKVINKSKLKAKLKKKKLKTQEFINNKNKPNNVCNDYISENQSTTETKLRLRDIGSLLIDCKPELVSDVKPKVSEDNSNTVESKKLTITEAKCNSLELKLQIPEPKLTIKEIKSMQTQSKPKETIITTTTSSTVSNSNQILANKLTITEVKNPTENLVDHNLKQINVDIPTTSSLTSDIGAVSPNNILLPNVLASKLSFALKKNVQFSQTKATYNNYKFGLNARKNVTAEMNYFTGFKKSENKSSPTCRNRPLSPVCLGFEPDEKSAKICKIMQEVVSNLDTDILVTSSSPIQTPEPIDHLVPEIRINSIPISTEPCNLQEVMSIVSSELNSSQDLTTPMLNEDSSSNDSETSSAQEEHQTEIASGEIIDPALIEKSSSNVIPFNQNIKTKSFHRSLMQTRVKRKSFLDVYRSNVFEQSDSDSSMSTPKMNSNNRSLTHGIDINSKGGAMFTTYYVNGILIIVQEFMITFWKQTALGNILGAQNMWLPNGSLQRILLERGCINRRSSEMVLSCENSIAYIELWTKQHESKFRECPIADVFATIYFHRGHGTPDKKVLQLENIKGYGHDVRFVVIKSSREIIVSWCDTFAEPIRTLVRSYQLAPDFQTISSVKEMEYINHCLLSLHNIQDCDDLVLGAGNEQLSVWNLRHGYLVTTLNLADTPTQSSLENKTLLLYAQCDTGFLFLIQQIEVGVLRLVAVNGMTQEWKQLQSYHVPPNYKELLGIIVESGVLMTCYTNGFLCWNMNNGQILAEIEMVDNIVLPTNKYLVAFKNYQVKVQHIMSYILTHDW